MIYLRTPPFFIVDAGVVVDAGGVVVRDEAVVVGVVVLLLQLEMIRLNNNIKLIIIKIGFFTESFLLYFFNA
jgi:hypothetical protein